MCNDYRLEVDIASIAEDFDNLQIKLDTPEGMPNVAAREDIKITDMAPVVRTSEKGRGHGELVNRRWSWPSPQGAPVYNFRSEGRSFASHRCLVLCDGFYEFTDPADKAQKRLDKWLFTMKGERWFCMAGVWREYGDEGAEAFSLSPWMPDPMWRPIIIARSSRSRPTNGPSGLTPKSRRSRCSSGCRGAAST